MERRLVERAMQGDEEAFDVMVGRIGDSLYSVARRILRDTTLAQDATQQALLAAWQNLRQLRSTRSGPSSTASSSPSPDFGEEH